jgi:hypothetical protein
MIIKLNVAKNQENDDYLIIDEIDHVNVGRVQINNEDWETFLKDYLSTYDYVNVTPPTRGDKISGSYTQIKAFRTTDGQYPQDRPYFYIITENDAYLCNNKGQTIERLISYCVTEEK